MRPLLIITFATTLLACPASRGEEPAPSIRDFDIKTIEKLGKELYRRDSLAASATDLLFAEHPEAREMKFGGWITELGDPVSRVYFLKRTEEEVRLGYITIYEAGKKPVIESHLNEPLPVEVARRLLARSNGRDAIPGFYDRPYNFEVLDDPDGDGFLVYSLAATTDANEIVAGGHSRVTISADGTTVESVDALSRSLLILQKKSPDVKEEIEAYTMSHVVSSTPVETHVFLSLMHGKPLYVVAGKESLWKVEEGLITELEMESEP